MGKGGFVHPSPFGEDGIRQFYQELLIFPDSVIEGRWFPEKPVSKAAGIAFAVFGFAVAIGAFLFMTLGSPIANVYVDRQILLGFMLIAAPVFWIATRKMASAAAPVAETVICVCIVCMVWPLVFLPGIAVETFRVLPLFVLLGCSMIAFPHKGEGRLCISAAAICFVGVLWYIYGNSLMEILAVRDIDALLAMLADLAIYVYPLIFLAIFRRNLKGSRKSVSFLLILLVTALYAVISGFEDRWIDIAVYISAVAMIVSLWKLRAGAWVMIAASVICALVFWEKYGSYDGFLLLVLGGIMMLFAVRRAEASISSFYSDVYHFVFREALWKLAPDHAGEAASEEESDE